MENTYTPLKEYLGTQGKDFSMANLAALATERGVQGYRGSDEQNRQLSTLLTPKVSTTTISNQNKVQQVPKMVNTLNTMAQGRGLTSDGTTTRYADGTIYNDNYQEPTLPPNTTPIYGTVNGQANRIIGYNSSNIATGQQIPTYFDSGTSTPAYSPEEQQFNDLLSQMRASTDAQTARTIASIQNRFETLRSQQKEINRAQQAGVQTALLTGGVTGKGSAAQYTPISSENIMAAQLNYGVQKLAELDSQEQDLIIEAQQAGESQNFKLLETKLAQVEKKREEKAKEAADLNKKIAEQNEKARQALIQSSRDNALADLYSQGVTDPTELLKALNETGGDFTLKEVTEGLKNVAPAIDDINKILSTAASNGAPMNVIAKIGQARSVAEATSLASQYLRDPLETAYKKAQIAKIYRDMEESGISQQYDPAQLVAYANQYATTGAIPTGIPKGSFGVIAQIAKETPKTKGQIVSNATGVAPTKDSEYASGLATMTSVVDLAKQLKELDKKRVGGVVSGTAGKVFGSEDQQAYVDLREQIVDLLSRARSGAALTVSEETRYKKMLPGRFSEPLGLGVDSDVRIQNFINTVESDLKNKASSKGWSIYGYSTVDIGGNQYKVGDIVDNGTQKGRVNPDGTITIIQ